MSARTKLVINADDFGLVSSVNQAVMEAYAAGQLTSATMMSNMPGTEEAAVLARSAPGLAVGLHFTLTEGSPVAARRTLAGPGGLFYPRGRLLRRLLAGRVDSAEIEAELAGQLDRLISLGVHPTHVDSHQHVHMIPAVLRAMAPVLRSRGLPVRMVRPPLGRGSFRVGPAKRSKQVVNRVAAWAARRRYPRFLNDFLVSIHDCTLRRPSDLDAAVYRALLGPVAGPGVVELMVHPYRDGSDLSGLYGTGKVPFLEKCFAEWRVLTTERIYDDESFELTNYRDLGQVSIRAAGPDDMDGIAKLMEAEHFGAGVSGEGLRHWFFANPAGRHSVQVARQADEIRGVASANCLAFTLEGSRALVAMPQKVLTSRRLRGWGAFGDLYREVEASLFEAPDVALMATVTNAASTPIFLGRFGYRRTLVPTVRWLPPWPMGRFRDEWRAVDAGELTSVGFASSLMERAAVKSPAYIKWRYGPGWGKRYVGYAERSGGDRMGLLVLARARRRGIPFLLLADFVGGDRTRAPAVLRGAQRLASVHRTLGVLVIENDFWAAALDSAPIAPRVPYRFNVLVKGRTAAETEAWAALAFNWSFGDWDFV